MYNTIFFFGLFVGYLLVFIYNVCRDAFVNHFGEDRRARVTILLGSLLCQFHLIAVGTQ